MQNPVDSFEIYVQDMERARAFYTSVFRVRLERLDTPDLELWAFRWWETTTAPPAP